MNRQKIILVILVVLLLFTACQNKELTSSIDETSNSSEEISSEEMSNEEITDTYTEEFITYQDEEVKELFIREGILEYNLNWEIIDTNDIFVSEYESDRIIDGNNNLHQINFENGEYALDLLAEGIKAVDENLKLNSKGKYGAFITQEGNYYYYNSDISNYSISQDKINEDVRMILDDKIFLTNDNKLVYISPVISEIYNRTNEEPIETEYIVLGENIVDARAIANGFVVLNEDKEIVIFYNTNKEDYVQGLKNLTKEVVAEDVEKIASYSRRSLPNAITSVYYLTQDGTLFEIREDSDWYGVVHAPIASGIKNVNTTSFPEAGIGSEFRLYFEMLVEDMNGNVYAISHINEPCVEAKFNNVNSNLDNIAFNYYRDEINGGLAVDLYKVEDGKLYVAKLEEGVGASIEYDEEESKILTAFNESMLGVWKEAKSDNTLEFVENEFGVSNRVVINNSDKKVTGEHSVSHIENNGNYILYVYKWGENDDVGVVRTLEVDFGEKGDGKILVKFNESGEFIEYIYN